MSRRDAIAGALGSVVTLLILAVIALVTQHGGDKLAYPDPKHTKGYVSRTFFPPETSQIPDDVRWYCEDGTPISAYPWGKNMPRDDGPDDNYVPIWDAGAITCADHGGMLYGHNLELR